MSSRSDLLTASFMVILSVVSILFTFTLVGVTRDIVFAVSLDGSNTKSGVQKNHYTFEGDDFPEVLPIELQPVEMVVEESVHFDLLSPEARLEWLATSPPGTGSIRMGKDNRSFFVSMFHQVHCLRYFRQALNGHPEEEHVHHCLNYLRQWTLCQADLTLESGDFISRNFTLQRQGETHVCRDWNTVFDEVSVNWVEWNKVLSDLVHNHASNESSSFTSNHGH
ncbi:hypothetical protein BJ138DRAFT_1112043 [Hygrophoropsis aurantiaca]|uniref:Uncharacterized protein n=1 Tax=Hygrophoropsis aurantiaca TaxID=72124 RepID=A0ACB8AHE3_9AGAM|nr:hypothetical protein BJ138DRAFT_1112043 [Hygrophoropsis aurantiaca]